MYRRICETTNQLILALEQVLGGAVILTQSHISIYFTSLPITLKEFIYPCVSIICRLLAPLHPNFDFYIPFFNSVDPYSTLKNILVSSPSSPTVKWEVMGTVAGLSWKVSPLPITATFLMEQS